MVRCFGGKGEGRERGRAQATWKLLCYYTLVRRIYISFFFFRTRTLIFSEHSYNRSTAFTLMESKPNKSLNIRCGRGVKEKRSWRNKVIIVG